MSSKDLNLNLGIKDNDILEKTHLNATSNEQILENNSHNDLKLDSYKTSNYINFSSPSKQDSATLASINAANALNQTTSNNENSNSIVTANEQIYNSKTIYKGKNNDEEEKPQIKNPDNEELIVKKISQDSSHMKIDDESLVGELKNEILVNKDNNEEKAKETNNEPEINEIPKDSLFEEIEDTIYPSQTDLDNQKQFFFIYNKAAEYSSNNINNNNKEAENFFNNQIPQFFYVNLNNMQGKCKLEFMFYLKDFLIFQEKYILLRMNYLNTMNKNELMCFLNLCDGNFPFYFNYIPFNFFPIKFIESTIKAFFIENKLKFSINNNTNNNNNLELFNSEKLDRCFNESYNPFYKFHLIFLKNANVLEKLITYLETPNLEVEYFLRTVFCIGKLLIAFDNLEENLILQFISNVVFFIERNFLMNNLYEKFEFMPTDSVNFNSNNNIINTNSNNNNNNNQFTKIMIEQLFRAFTQISICLGFHLNLKIFKQYFTNEYFNVAYNAQIIKQDLSTGKLTDNKLKLIVELFSLPTRMIFLLLNSSSLEKRNIAILLLNEQINYISTTDKMKEQVKELDNTNNLSNNNSNTNNNIHNSIKVNEDYIKQLSIVKDIGLYMKSFLSAWLLEVKIFEMIFGEKIHEAIIIKSGFCLNFMYQNNLLEFDNIRRIWKFAQEKHESISSSILSLLSEIVSFLSIEHCMYILKEISELNLVDINTATLKILESFSNNQNLFVKKEVNNKFNCNGININNNVSVNTDNNNENFNKNNNKQFENLIKSPNLDNLTIPSMVKGIENTVSTDTINKNIDNDNVNNKEENIEEEEVVFNESTAIKQFKTYYLKLLWKLVNERNFYKGLNQQIIVKSRMVFASIIIKPFFKYDLAKYLKKLISSICTHNFINTNISLLELILKNIKNNTSENKREILIDGATTVEELISSLDSNYKLFPSLFHSIIALKSEVIGLTDEIINTISSNIENENINSEITNTDNAIGLTNNNNNIDNDINQILNNYDYRTVNSNNYSFKNINLISNNLLFKNNDFMTENNKKEKIITSNDIFSIENDNDNEKTNRPHNTPKSKLIEVLNEPLKINANTTTHINSNLSELGDNNGNYNDVDVEMEGTKAHLDETLSTEKSVKKSISTISTECSQNEKVKIEIVKHFLDSYVHNTNPSNNKNNISTSYNNNSNNSNNKDKLPENLLENFEFVFKHLKLNFLAENYFTVLQQILEFIKFALFNSSINIKQNYVDFMFSLLVENGVNEEEKNLFYGFFTSIIKHQQLTGKKILSEETMGYLLFDILLKMDLRELSLCGFHLFQIIFFTFNSNYGSFTVVQNKVTRIVDCSKILGLESLWRVFLKSKFKLVQLEAQSILVNILNVLMKQFLDVNGNKNSNNNNKQDYNININDPDFMNNANEDYIMNNANNDNNIYQMNAPFNTEAIKNINNNTNNNTNTNNNIVDSEAFEHNINYIFDELTQRKEFLEEIERNNLGFITEVIVKFNEENYNLNIESTINNAKNQNKGVKNKKHDLNNNNNSNYCEGNYLDGTVLKQPFVSINNFINNSNTNTNNSNNNTNNYNYLSQLISLSNSINTNLLLEEEVFQIAVSVKESLETINRLINLLSIINFQRKPLEKLVEAEIVTVAVNSFFQNNEGKKYFIQLNMDTTVLELRRQIAVKLISEMKISSLTTVEHLEANLFLLYKSKSLNNNKQTLKDIKYEVGSYVIVHEGSHKKTEEPKEHDLNEMISQVRCMFELEELFIKKALARNNYKVEETVLWLTDDSNILSIEQEIEEDRLNGNINSLNEVNDINSIFNTNAAINNNNNNSHYNLYSDVRKNYNIFSDDRVSLLKKLLSLNISVLDKSIWGLLAVVTYSDSLTAKFTDLASFKPEREFDIVENNFIDLLFNLKVVNSLVFGDKFFNFKKLDEGRRNEWKVNFLFANGVSELIKIINLVLGEMKKILDNEKDNESKINNIKFLTGQESITNSNNNNNKNDFNINASANNTINNNINTNYCKSNKSLMNTYREILQISIKWVHFLTLSSAISLSQSKDFLNSAIKILFQNRPTGVAIGITNSSNSNTTSKDSTPSQRTPTFGSPHTSFDVENKSQKSKTNIFSGLSNIIGTEEYDSLDEDISNSFFVTLIQFNLYQTILKFIELAAENINAINNNNLSSVFFLVLEIHAVLNEMDPESFRSFLEKELEGNLLMEHLFNHKTPKQIRKVIETIFVIIAQSKVHENTSSSVSNFGSTNNTGNVNSIMNTSLKNDVTNKKYKSSKEALIIHVNKNYNKVICMIDYSKNSASNDNRTVISTNDNTSYKISHNNNNNNTIENSCTHKKSKQELVVKTITEEYFNLYSYLIQNSGDIRKEIQSELNISNLCFTLIKNLVMIAESSTSLNEFEQEQLAGYLTLTQTLCSTYESVFSTSLNQVETEFEFKFIDFLYKNLFLFENEINNSTMTSNTNTKEVKSSLLRIKNEKQTVGFKFNSKNLRYKAYSILLQLSKIREDIKKTLADKLISHHKSLKKQIQNIDFDTNLRYQSERYVGLRNYGATCYLNSLLQQLYMVKDFKKTINNIQMKEITDELVKKENYYNKKKVNSNNDSTSVIQNSCYRSNSSKVFNFSFGLHEEVNRIKSISNNTEVNSKNNNSNNKSGSNISNTNNNNSINNTNGNSKEESENLNFNIIYQTQLLFANLDSTAKQYHSPMHFIKSFKKAFNNIPIDTRVQQDCEEFFNMYVDNLEECSKQKTLFSEIFKVKVSNEVISMNNFYPYYSESECENNSITIDIKNKANLEAAFQQYIKTEILDGDNMFYLEKYDKKVPIIKRSSIKNLGKVAIIHLKRFDFDFTTFEKTKLNDFFEFPKVFDFKPYLRDTILMKSKDESYMKDVIVKSEIDLEDDFRYELTGVLIHSGSSADAGHYYSFIKSEDDGCWYEFDDSKVSLVSEEKVFREGFGEDKSKDDKNEYDVESSNKNYYSKSTNAYMLFYTKINIKNNVNNPNNSINSSDYDIEIGVTSTKEELNNFNTGNANITLSLEEENGEKPNNSTKIIKNKNDNNNTSSCKFNNEELSFNWALSKIYSKVYEENKLFLKYKTFTEFDYYSFLKDFIEMNVLGKNKTVEKISSKERSMSKFDRYEEIVSRRCISLLETEGIQLNDSLQIEAIEKIYNELLKEVVNEIPCKNDLPNLNVETALPVIPGVTDVIKGTNAAEYYKSQKVIASTDIKDLNNSKNEKNDKDSKIKSKVTSNKNIENSNTNNNINKEKTIKSKLIKLAIYYYFEILIEQGDKSRLTLFSILLRDLLDTDRELCAWVLKRLMENEDIFVELCLGNNNADIRESFSRIVANCISSCMKDEEKILNLSYPVLKVKKEENIIVKNLNNTSVHSSNIHQQEQFNNTIDANINSVVTNNSNTDKNHYEIKYLPVSCVMRFFKKLFLGLFDYTRNYWTKYNQFMSIILEYINLKHPTIVYTCVQENFFIKLVYFIMNNSDGFDTILPKMGGISMPNLSMPISVLAELLCCFVTKGAYDLKLYCIYNKFQGGINIIDYPDEYYFILNKSIFSNIFTRYYNESTKKILHHLSWGLEDRSTQICLLLIELIKENFRDANSLINLINNYHGILEMDDVFKHKRLSLLFGLKNEKDSFINFLIGNRDTFTYQTLICLRYFADLMSKYSYVIEYFFKNNCKFLWVYYLIKQIYSDQIRFDNLQIEASNDGLHLNEILGVIKDKYLEGLKIRLIILQENSGVADNIEFNNDPEFYYDF